MKRRDIIRQLFFGAVSAKTVLSSAAVKDRGTRELVPGSKNSFHSKWHLFADMYWTGEDLWVQRLQDWCIIDGELQCMVHAADRTVNVLTHQLSAENKSFKAVMEFRFNNNATGADTSDHYAGFRSGLKGRYEDYRSAIFTGTGINAGIGRNGKIFIGNVTGEKTVDENILTSFVRLELTVTPAGTGADHSKLTAYDKSGNSICSIETSDYNAAGWQGNIAMVSHCKAGKAQSDEYSVSIKNFFIEGEKLDYHPEQVYGPVYFAQYTTNNSILKLTAQLAPVDIAGNKVSLQIKNGNAWKEIAEVAVHPLARTANFRIEKWDTTVSHQYKIVYPLVLKNGKSKQFTYEGTIAAEPLNKNEIKALVFSCNWDYGFPDNEVVENASKHNADMLFFLGDQFYEPNGGFAVQMAPLEKSVLDYLRKWYMFGWSYRELFRHKPMAALPDDHDMYHGNIWGAGGRATIPPFDGAKAQDSGGYKMPAGWVNMAQLTQTSHMPDAYDPNPVLQGINVYYNEWVYAGISFGIIEDRKFKSPPKDILPDDAKVFNGYAENPGYDHSKLKNMEAGLLGERQIKFLADWSNKKNKDIQFNVLVSATPFCCLQTLPAGTKNDQVTPDLPVPAKGEYVTGDLPTQDMDSNGWPHNRRDEVLKLLGKNFHLHLAGDQHLGSVVQYGTDEFADSAFCFAVPALSNLWPRRWWPSPEKDHVPLPGKPRYTGNFKDGFGNKITVHAAASPHKTGRLPAILYDRVTGYGVVEFDKAAKKISLHCWPRYAKPEEGNAGQYEGWPVSFQV